jgi:hypothetical protein
MREEPKLHLGVVEGREEPLLPLCVEGATNRAPLLGPDRDVLETWVARAQTSRRGNRLVKRGMDPPGLWIHKSREGIDVSCFKFKGLAVRQEELR